MLLMTLRGFSPMENMAYRGCNGDLVCYHLIAQSVEDREASKSIKYL